MSRARRRASSFALIAAAILASSACVLFPSFDGFEGAAESGDATTSDVTAEADGPLPSDAGMDAASCSSDAAGVVVAQSLDQVGGLALSASFVCYTEQRNGTVSCAPRGDSGATVNERSGTSAPTLLVVDDRTIFVVGIGSACIYSCPLNPQAICYCYQPLNPTIPTKGLALDSQFVYWTVYANGGSTVLKCSRPTDGGLCAAAMALDGYQSQDHPWGLAIGPQDAGPQIAYWANSGGIGSDASAGSVETVNLGVDAGPATVLDFPFNGYVSHPQNMTLSSNGYLFWTALGDADGGGTDAVVMGCEAGVCNRSAAVFAHQPIAGPTNGILGITSDAKNVYWIAPSGGSIESCSVGGCDKPTTVVCGTPGSPIIALATDDQDDLYYATSEEVYRIAK